jgi:hypothetical protein
MAVPPTVEFEVLENHWYEAVPVPPEKFTVKGTDSVTPAQIFCMASGCNEMVAIGVMVTAAVALVILAQPPEERVITQ